MSICSNPYGNPECAHIEGLSYTGQFCRQLVESMILQRIDFVEIPKTKKHRLLTYTIDGITEDRMTGVRTRSEKVLKTECDNVIGFGTFQFPLE